SASSAALAQGPAPEPTRTIIQRRDLSGVPEREVIQAAVDFVPGALAPKHSHPGDEVVYVVEGRIEYQLEGESPITLTAGHGMFIPAGTPHTAKNVGTTGARELATYIVEKGKPLATPVQ